MAALSRASSPRSTADPTCAPGDRIYLAQARSQRPPRQRCAQIVCRRCDRCAAEAGVPQEQGSIDCPAGGAADVRPCSRSPHRDGQRHRHRELHQRRKERDNFAGYGIFQRDLQFFKDDPDYFLNQAWVDFDRCLDEAVKELKKALRNLGYADKPSLTDLQLCFVAIVYNTGFGNFDEDRGLKQGFEDEDGVFYGEHIAKLLNASKAVPIPSDTPAAVQIPGRYVVSARPISILEVDRVPRRYQAEPRQWHRHTCPRIRRRRTRQMGARGYRGRWRARWLRPRELHCSSLSCMAGPIHRCDARLSDSEGKSIRCMFSKQAGVGREGRAVAGHLRSCQRSPRGGLGWRYLEMATIDQSGLVGKIRDKPIGQKLEGVLQRAATAAGIDTVWVTSGSQPGTTGRRTGSTRHDNGRAANLQLVRGGRTSSFSRIRDGGPIVEAFVTAAAANGATGIGAGEQYIGEQDTPCRVRNIASRSLKVGVGRRRTIRECTGLAERGRKKGLGECKLSEAASSTSAVRSLAVL